MSLSNPLTIDWQQLLLAIMRNCTLLILMPLGFAALLTVINRSTKTRLARWWPRSQIVIGGLGTIIHELSHALFCLIFNHQITDMQLLNRNLNDPNDHSLGHVEHRYRSGRLWPTIGNFWIGLAPILGCSAAILGLTWLLARNTFQTWLTFAGEPTWQWQAIKPLFSQLLMTTKPSLLLIWLILCGMIAIGGFDLSKADYRGMIPGIIATLIVIIGGTFIASLFNQTTSGTSWLLTILTPLMVILTIVVLLSLISWLIVATLLKMPQRSRYHARH
ncbi:hypothetical protein [Latilactobacillus sakei]|uniref:hypothetical protein n=1 Tax=Latilactobacillus sakei TaxID=1599 RepID=UPI001BD45ADE|nr:hypothetical protein [Latilactobacillus sakei]QVQ48588.1 hypothetical protein KIK01_08245 [Latilactobacillus sakei subsp. sakei]